MKPLAAILLALVLTSCSNQESMSEAAAASASLAAVESSSPVVEASEPIATSEPPADAKIAEARTAVEKWHADTKRQQVFLEDAYHSGEVATLQRESLSMASKPGLPGGDVWQTYEYAPYLKCDTAWNDLGIYANAMYIALHDPKADTRKILAKEKEDYERSLAYCEKRLKMAPAEAWKDYEAN